MENIHMTGICKSFAGTPVLENWNMELETGSCTVLMGPSGRGKTTLLRILMKLEQADSGIITGMPAKLSAVFQEDRLCPDFSALDNIAMVMPGRRQEKLILSHLGETGLQNSARQPVSQLSGGMQRRVSLVRAILADSDMILLDEPFKGLDEECRERMIAYFKRHTAGKTTLVITHDPEEARLLGGRLITMQ